MFANSFNLGRNQVAVGLVPIDFANKSSESALSVYPVAIANCKENRLVPYYYLSINIITDLLVLAAIRHVINDFWSVKV